MIFFKQFGENMKKLLTLLIAIAVVSGMSFAQTTKAPLAINEGTGTSYAVPSLGTDLQDFNTPKYPGDRPLVDKFIDTLRDATFSFYGFVTPVVYEPNSNTLIEVQNFRYVPQGSQSLYGNVYIKYSQNYGQTWTKREFYNQADHIPVWPSIAVMNTQNATNPDDFNYVITAPVAIAQGGQYPWGGDIWLIAEGGNPDVSELILDYPVEGQRWFWTRAAANVVANDEVYYNVGTLANETGYQYGQYGSSAFNFNLGDFNFQGTPDAWSVDKFRPSNDINSSYNDYLYIDVDNEGAAYVGVRNMFADDPDNRVPAVSKSTDGGETWSEFDRMPITLLENYYTVYGGDPTKSAMIPYKSEGFVVWGPDSWSFLFRVFIYKAENDFEFHIVEAFKANGAWGIRKVADWSGLIQIVMDDVGQNNLYKDSLRASRLGNEVQIVRTKDSKYLVAKWVDYVDTTLTVDPPIFLETANGRDTLTKIQSNDVFMAYRETSNPNWGQTMNVTNNPAIDKCTYLPLIIPDLEHVPLFQLSTFMSQYSDPNHPRNNYPPNGWQLIIDTWQGLGFSNINLTGTVGVEEEENYDFSVNEVYPNPATDFAEFTFNLDRSSFVKVEVYNAMGQKVNTLLNQMLDIGLHGLTLDLSKYSSGSYYIRMTVNGHSITKSLSVIR
jgi:hypothetical protein